MMVWYIIDFFSSGVSGFPRIRWPPAPWSCRYHGGTRPHLDRGACGRQLQEVPRAMASRAVFTL